MKSWVEVFWSESQINFPFSSGYLLLALLLNPDLNLFKGWKFDFCVRPYYIYDYDLFVQKKAYQAKPKYRPKYENKAEWNYFLHRYWRHAFSMVRSDLFLSRFLLLRILEIHQINHRSCTKSCTYEQNDQVSHWIVYFEIIIRIYFHIYFSFAFFTLNYWASRHISLSQLILKAVLMCETVTLTYGNHVPMNYRLSTLCAIFSQSEHVLLLLNLYLSSSHHFLHKPEWLNIRVIHWTFGHYFVT